MVRHGDLDDARTGPRRVSRDEAVHLAVQLHVVEHVTAVCLEGAAVVVKVNSSHARDEPVGEPRRNLATERVMPLFAPAAYDVVPLLQLVQQALDVDRVVLQITVHEDQDLALTVLNAGLQSCRLAEVAPEANNADARIAIH